MMQLFFLAILALPAFAQMPEFLRSPDEANILPATIREKMVLAEQKVGEARAKHQAWIRAQPRPGYVGAVAQRRREFLAAHESAIKAVGQAMSGVQTLPRHSQNVVFGWAKETLRRLNRRQPDAPRARFFRTHLKNSLISWPIFEMGSNGATGLITRIPV